jgi:F-type H+-transporting ATPase subunit b
MLSITPMGVLLSSGSPIDLDGSFFVQLGIFFVAFLILRALVFKPVMELFDARTAAMSGSKELAEKMSGEADATRESFENQLRTVRGKANEERDKKRAEAQQLARDLTSKARQQTTAQLSAAKNRLDMEARDARSKAEAEVPELARKIGEKLLGRSVS